MNRLCPVCKTSYPSDVNFCTKDGTQLVANADNPATEQFNQSINNPFERKAAVEGSYIKASIGNRVAAALIDCLILIGVSIPAAAVLLFAFFSALGNQEELTIVLCIAGALLSLVPLAFLLLKDGYRNGQSPGKKSMKLVVIDLESNMPCSKQQSCIRNVIFMLLGIVPFIGNLIEPIMVFATNDGRRLGDRAAKTMVIDKTDY